MVMEMENAALQQMMMTQTMVLEEIRSMRMSQMNNSTVGVQNPNSVNFTPEAAPVNFDTQNSYMTPPSADPMAAYGGFEPLESSMVSSPLNMTQPVDPTKYSSISAIPVIGQPIDMTKQTAEDIIKIDPSRMSREQINEHFSMRSQDMQISTVEGVGKTAGFAAGIGSMFVGGLLPSLAVGAVVGGTAGYMTDAMVSGAKDSLMYQDILRRDGYKAFNAFESTTEYGGIGMGLDDQQDISGFLRDLADEKFLSDPEMAQILQGGLDNKLLKSVSDVKEFKEKMTKIVDTTKEISLILNKSIDETMQFLGEMERRGISTDKGTMLSSQFKVGASMTGTDASQFTDNVLAQVDVITSGTSTNTTNIATGISANAYMLSAVEEMSKQGDGTLYQYIKNNGGSSQVAGIVEEAQRSFIAGAGSQQLVAMFGTAFTKGEDGQFTLDRTSFENLLDSGKSYKELMDMSADYTNSMDPTDIAKLTASAGQAFNETATSFDTSRLIGYVQQQYQDMGMDPQTALMRMGLASDYNEAELMNAMIAQSSNPQVQAQFEARSRVEEYDAIELAHTPGIRKKIKFFFESNFGNPLGDFGQSISDTVGDISQDAQMMLAGIEESGRVTGSVLPELTKENINAMYNGENSSLSEIRDVIKSFEEAEESGAIGARGALHRRSATEGLRDPYTSENLEEKEAPKRTFSNDEFERMSDLLDSGQASSADLRSLRDMYEATGDQELDGASKERIEYLLNREAGEYKGFMGTLDRIGDWTKATSYMGDPIFGENTKGTNSFEEIESIQKQLRKNYEEKNSELNALMAGDTDLGTENYTDLEIAIREGDTATVQSMTSNVAAQQLAADYKALNDQNKSVEEASLTYQEMLRMGKGAGEYAKNFTELLIASGTISEDEAMYYEDFEKDVEKISNKIGKDMSDEALRDSTLEIMTLMEDRFSSLSQTDLKTMAQHLDNNSSTISMEKLLTENGNIDPRKLSEAFINEQRLGNSDPIPVEGDAENGDVVKAASEHEEAMKTFTDTLISEVAYLGKQVDNIQNNSYRNYTSVTGP